MSNWYHMDKPTILKALHTDEAAGLTTEEALKKQNECGKNEFEKEKQESIFHKILNQLKDISTIILLVAVALSFALAVKEGHGFLEPVVIVSIVILNIILAITQESSAEKSLDALAKMNTPTCVVLRDGMQKKLDSTDLVPGDIVLLKAGDLVPADGRLLKAVDLQVDESSLTGESEAAEKNIDTIEEEKVGIGDQSNMVFSGCLVKAGNGVCVVTEIGMKTQMGKIAAFLNNTQKMMTPLQVRLAKIGKVISFVAIISAVILFAVGLLRGESVWQMVLMAVSLAVAAVPETLALIVTLSLSNGVKKMVEKNAIIRKLSAVETLGNTSVICSDKTGTLTQNQMTIMKFWQKSGEPAEASASFTDQQLEMLEQLALASNAVMETDEQGKKHIFGDATETAILKLLDDKGKRKEEIEARWPRVKEIPFSSSRKRMTTIHKDPDGGYLVLCKGALDWMPLRQTESEKEITKKVHDSFTGKALRVITIAGKRVEELPDDSNLESIEKDLEMKGLIGIIDPPRRESKVAIAAAKKAGIRTVMITGDHVTTAAAIAQEIGLLNEGEKVMTGQQLSEMSDEELCSSIREYSVYARVTPEDKIRIVEAWQENDEVVVMTGDGVNDAPALKAADVGVAMGKNGTEVAKNAADMVLADDNFASIVDAIHEGRNVFSNIRKTIYFLIVCNISEIIIMLGAQLIGWQFPVTAVMLLLINVLGDGIPGICLAKEVSDPRIMERKPIGREESFFNSNLTKVIIRQTVVCAAIVLAGYYIGTNILVSATHAPSHAIGQSMSFLILGWSSILHVFTVRSRKSVFHYKMRENMPMVYSSAAMIVIFALIVLIPGVGMIFGIKPIGAIHWLIVAGLSIIPFVVAEIGKFIDNYEINQKYRKRLMKHREFDD